MFNHSAVNECSILSDDRCLTCVSHQTKVYLDA